MPITYKNCFRSHAGSVIELSNQQTPAEKPSTLASASVSDDAIPPRSETVSANTARRTIKQYFFYD